MKKTLAIHFANLGPYHLARLESAGEILGPLGWRVVAFEIAGSDENYGWAKNDGHEGFERVTVFPNAAFQRIGGGRLKKGIREALDTFNPTAMAIAGWGTPDARLCLRWCKRNGVQAIVMSETRAVDGQRVWWREWFKSRIVRQFDAGLCGGESHRRYLVELGMPEECVALGYNVVDNQFFGEIRNAKCGMGNGELGVGSLESGAEGKAESGNTEKLKAGSGNSPGSSRPPHATSPEALALDAGRWALGAGLSARQPYFLASSRFIRRKNVERLIQAYYLYSTLSKGEIWPLVLLGDGDLRGELIARARELGLRIADGAQHVAGSVERREERKAEKLKLGKAESGKPPVTTHPQPDTAPEALALDAGRSTFDPVARGAVIFAGWRQIEELAGIYQRAGAFVHPALEEPWGLVINEAMAAGLPVLSSRNVGAAEELVREADNGFLFDPRDSYQIARYMGLISRLPRAEREAMGRKSREIVEAKAPKNAFGLGLKKLLSPNEC